MAWMYIYGARIFMAGRSPCGHNGPLYIRYSLDLFNLSLVSNTTDQSDPNVPTCPSFIDGIYKLILGIRKAHDARDSSSLSFAAGIIPAWTEGREGNDDIGV